jgi:hypothetical protein
MKPCLQKINKQQRIVYERHFAVNRYVPTGGGDVEFLAIAAIHIL